MALDPPRKKVREKATIRRAGNKGCLPMTLDDYLSLLDWTGRQIRREKGKQGHISADSPAILERLKCDAATWLDYVNNFRQRFRNEAGLATSRQSFRNARMTTRQPSKLAT